MTFENTSKICHLFSFLTLFFFTACFFVSPISVSVTTVMYLLAFLFLLLSGDWSARWYRLKNNKAALSFWLIAGLFIIGIFYTTSTTQFILHDLQKRHWLFMTPLFIVAITDDVWRQRMVNAFLCAMIITLCFSIPQNIFHINFPSIIHLMKPQKGGGVFSDHIIQNIAMNIAAFICAYRFLFEKKYRALYGILFILMGIDIIFMSTGRTGYAIFFLLLCYLGLIRFGWKGILSAIILGSVVMTVAYFGSSNFQRRANEVVQQYTHYHQIHHVTPIGQRLEMYHIAEKMIHERPWFGYGTGGISTALSSVVPAKDRVFNPHLDFVESIYLNFLLEFGIVGLSVFLIAIFMQIKTSFALPHQYRCLMQAILLIVLVGGIFNSFFVSFVVAHFYALFSALCFSSKDANG